MPSPLILKPDPNDRRPDRYIVLCEGREVGQIFDRVPGASASHDATWWWGLSGNYRENPSDGAGSAGSAVSREAAMAAFRAAWDQAVDQRHHFHDCPHCDGKANIPVLGRPAFKCTRCGKVTPEAELRRLSMRRAPPDDD
jgi:ribosomal protein L37AE/L43A